MNTHDAVHDWPSHVADSLVVDYDPVAGPEVSAHPPSALDGLRATHRIFYTTFGGGYWVPTRYDDIRAGFRDTEMFPQWGTVSQNWTGRMHIPLRLNPPEHHAYRKMLLGMFSPARLATLEPMIRRTARERLASLNPDVACEFAGDFAITLPAATFCGLLGLPPEEFGTFNGLSFDLVYGAERTRELEGDDAAAAQRSRAMTTIETIIADLIPVRAAQPGSDIISFLLSAEVDGRKLTVEEIQNIASLMFFAGTDSTGSMIAYCVGFLAEHPDYRQALVAEPALIGRAAEELSRFHGFHHLVRDVARDGQFAGVEMKRGDRILLHTGGGNHDDAMFPEACRVRFDRAEPGNMTFGNGIHRCLGAPLAMLELRVALEELHRTHPNYRIPAGERVEYVGGQSKVIPSRVPLLLNGA